MTKAQDGCKDVSLTHRPPLPPGNAPGTHFCWSLSRPQVHSAIGRIMSMTPPGIEPETFQFVTQHFNHCATAVPLTILPGYIFTQFPSTLCTNMDPPIMLQGHSLHTLLCQHIWQSQLSKLHASQRQSFLTPFKSLVTTPPPPFFLVNITALRPTQLRIQRSNEALFSGVKQPGREGDLSPPPSAKFNNIWIYSSTPRSGHWEGLILVLRCPARCV